MSRRRTNRQTAVRITAHLDVDDARWSETAVWVVEDYSPELMDEVIDSNPALFPSDLRFTFRAIMTWHSAGRFRRWAQRQKQASLRGWMGGMRLA